MPKVGTKRNFAYSTCNSSQDTATSKPNPTQSAEVDAQVPSSASFEVAHDSSGSALSSYLMKSCGSTNNNKYYILQVLRSKGTDKYFLHTRYGRVGCTASNTQALMSQDAAVKAY